MAVLKQSTALAALNALPMKRSRTSFDMDTAGYYRDLRYEEADEKRICSSAHVAARGRREVHHVV